MFGWKNVFVSSLAVLLVSACGSSKKSPGSSTPAPSTPDSSTSTLDTSPVKTYTSFSPQEEIQVIKDAVPVTDENKAFAQTIETVSLSSKTFQPVEIQISLKLTTSPQVLTFEGTFEQAGDSYNSELKEPEGQNAGLKINASSKTPDFSVVSLIITDASGRKAGVMIRQEARTLKLRVPTLAPEAPAPPEVDPETKKVLDQYKDGKDVVVSSTEVYQAKSYYEIHEKTDSPSPSPSLLKGELLATDGSEVETAAEGTIAKLGKPVLVGNTNDGDGLVWKISANTPDAPISAYEVLEPRKAPVSPPPQVSVPNKVPTPPKKVEDAANYCGFQVGGKVVHSYVKQVLADCQNELVIHYVKSFWLSPNNGRKKLEHFLELNQAGNLDNPSGDGAQFKTMVKVLRKQNYPSAWGFITILESDFQPKAANSSSTAYGWWQFLQGTAKDYGLKLSPVDQRTQIEPSTLAATKYFTYLFGLWNGDIKMAIASYKYGEGHMQSAERDADRRHLLNADFSKDFWELVQYRMIDTETKDYVLKFISGVLVSVDPQTHGLVQPAIDLN